MKPKCQHEAVQSGGDFMVWYGTCALEVIWILNWSRDDSDRLLTFYHARIAGLEETWVWIKTFLRLVSNQLTMDHEMTALHWAAKHGNLDVIKLMAGTHKLDSNAKTVLGSLRPSVRPPTWVPMATCQSPKRGMKSSPSNISPFSLPHLPSSSSSSPSWPLLTDPWIAERNLTNLKSCLRLTSSNGCSVVRKIFIILLSDVKRRRLVVAKSKQGYTPLHIAAMYGNEEIMEVLINTYGADSNARDYSGKRPLHYLPKNQAERFLSLYPSLTFPIIMCGKNAGGKGEKEPGLMRMGSLNSKMKKPSVLSASGRAITRMKSWGSADNIPDRAMNLMPPPKTFPKKKKSRKHTDIIGISENWRNRIPDSDSDSATGITS
ncbi:uncharacterized protein TNCT_337562 [Trichonephila clavata]|uniref:Ankyrin repeat protein n=1 Tax=Trichonephila clavata TaxID=2740835 RepID=A0A8X6HRD5_TRICU|nr:uncharacterized protein TNCT_337562 [Trichonephila clavata]